MTERVREILSNYAGESPGVLTNLARILNHGRLAGTGRMVILPVDQGVEHGPARTFAPNPAGFIAMQAAARKIHDTRSLMSVEDDIVPVAEVFRLQDAKWSTLTEVL